MRDLARSSVFSRKRGRRKNPIKVLGIVLIVVIVSFVVGNLGSFKGTGGVQSGPVVLENAPAGLTPVSLEGIELATAEGITLTTQNASMKDLRYDGEATATVSRAFGAGIYKLDVAGNLPDPKDVDYAVWLYSDPEEPILVDYMRGEGTKWTLDISGADKFSQYKGVYITLERTKDEIPEEKIMQGTF